MAAERRPQSSFNGAQSSSQSHSLRGLWSLPAVVRGQVQIADPSRAFLPPLPPRQQSRVVAPSLRFTTRF